MDRFTEKYEIDAGSGCWLWKNTTHRYGQYKLANKVENAHRVSWKRHRGKIPDGLCVLHHCDTPLCVNPDHLFLGSHQDNMTDKRVKGRCSRIGKHALSDEQENQVRIDVDAGISQRKVATKFGVCQSTVWKLSSDRPSA